MQENVGPIWAQTNKEKKKKTLDVIKLVKMKAFLLHQHIVDVQTTAGAVLQSAGSEHLPLSQATAGHVDENRRVIFHNSDRRQGRTDRPRP